MKERITITLDKNLIQQIDKRIDGIDIKNRSQEIENLLSESLGANIPRKAVLLVGGKGTRLKPLTDRIPKALLEVQGKAVTEHIFDLLKKYGIRDVILCVGYLKDKIKEHFGDGSRFGVNIIYIEENEPLGTAGPLKLAKKNLKKKIKRRLGLKGGREGFATLVLRTVDDPSQYGFASWTAPG